MNDGPTMQDEWINATKIAKILGTNKIAVYRMAKRGEIRTKVLPSCLPLYSRSDAERLAAQAIRPARGAAVAV